MNHKIIYFFPPPKPLLITNTDSGHKASKMSGEVYRDASTSSTDDERASLNSLNSDIFSINYQITRRGYTINSGKAEIHQILEIAI